MAYLCTCRYACLLCCCPAKNDFLRAKAATAFSAS